jgi:hypothetical protein
MKYVIFKFAVILFVTAIFFLLGCSSKESKKERLFSSIVLEDSISLDLPLLRFQKYQNGFYAYDFSEKSIVKLDSEFNLIDRLGSWGDGPKENLLIRNYKILDEDLVAIFDVEKNTFKIQDFKDSVYVYKKFDFNIHGGIYTDSTSIIISRISDKMRMEFLRTNLNSSETEILLEINNFFVEDYSGLTFEGKINELDGKIYFTSYFSSFWFIYDIHTKEIKSGKYIYDYNKPKVLDTGGMVMLEDAPELIYDSFISSRYMFIVSNLADRNYPDQRILDIYDIGNFEYLQSFPLPNLNDTSPDEGFYIDDSKIAILYEDKVYFFKLSLSK